MSEQNIIEINEPVVETKKQEFTTEGLSEPEIELAKKNGLIKETEKKEEKEVNADKVEPKDEDKEDSKEEEKIVQFEDVE